MDIQQINTLIKQHKEQIISDISQLVAIHSYRDEKSKCSLAPFGQGVRMVFDEFMHIARRLGFLCHDFSGYAIDVRYGEFDEYIAMLGHLDVVDIFHRELWQSDPFTLRNDGEFLYGRGVADDKGPSILALYALYFAKLLHFPLKRSIRLILGGAEETTWECMEHYFKHNAQPSAGFSPDGDFPIVNGEKGILEGQYIFPENTVVKAPILSITPKTTSSFVCYELDVTFSFEFFAKNQNKLHGKLIAQTEETTILKYIGKTSLSRNPQRGVSAIDLLFDDLCAIPSFNWSEYPALHFYKDYLHNDFYGKKLGIYHKDNEMGESSICPVALVYEAGTNKSYIKVDIRFNKAVSLEHLKAQLNRPRTFKITKYKKMLYVNKDSKLIRTLQKAYWEYTNQEAELITKGGASYARTLENGVAFGPTFAGDNPNPHGANENIRMDTMWKALGIYTLSLYYLSCEK